MSIEALNYARRVRIGNTTAKFVLTRLADRADERFSCYPAVELIAAEIETSSRTVQRALALLRDLRLISDRSSWRADGSQTTSRYYLHGPWDDYAGTGTPFPEIVEPKQARAERWATAPAEGEWREGTAAAVVVRGDEEQAEAAERRAAEARARVEAAQTSRQARARKAGSVRPGTGAGRARAGALEGREGVTAMSPPPLTAMSPPGATLMSPLEPSVPTTSAEPVVSAVGQGAGGFARAGVRDSAGAQDADAKGDFVADHKSPQPEKKQRPRRRRSSGARRITEVRPVAGEPEAWDILGPVLAEAGIRHATRPPTLRRAVRLLLGHDADARGGTPYTAFPRRPEHVLGRLNQGWYRARGPERAAPGYDGPDAIRRPVGYLAEVLTAHECARPECELGVLLTTGAECTECGAREAERAAARLAARWERETAALADGQSESHPAGQRATAGR